ARAPRDLRQAASATAPSAAFFSLAAGEAAAAFFPGLPYCESRSISASSSSWRAATFSMSFAAALSRKVAKSSMLIESFSPGGLPHQLDRQLSRDRLLPDPFPGDKNGGTFIHRAHGSRKISLRARQTFIDVLQITILRRSLPNRAPIGAANRRGTRLT